MLQPWTLDKEAGGDSQLRRRLSIFPRKHSVAAETQARMNLSNQFSLRSSLTEAKEPHKAFSVQSPACRLVRRLTKQSDQQEAVRGTLLKVNIGSRCTILLLHYCFKEKLQMHKWPTFAHHRPRGDKTNIPACQHLLSEGLWQADFCLMIHNSSAQRENLSRGHVSLTAAISGLCMHVSCVQDGWRTRNLIIVTS